MYVYMYVYVCLYVCVCVSMRACVCVYKFLCMCLNVFKYSCLILLLLLLPRGSFHWIILVFFLLCTALVGICASNFDALSAVYTIGECTETCRYDLKILRGAFAKSDSSGPLCPRKQHFCA